MPPTERRRYLDIAIGQSCKVGALAQSLFELARLERGGIETAKEAFSLGELVQDVFQTFELAAEARRQRPVADSGPGVPSAPHWSLFTRTAGRVGWRYGPEAAGGLGLQIVRRILQLHDSDIRLDERPGSGALFRFLLQAA